MEKEKVFVFVRQGDELSDQRYRNVFTHENPHHCVDYLPVLSFTETWQEDYRLSPINFLQNWSKDLNQCQGVILTSPRAANIFAQIISLLSSLASVLAKLRIFVVGESSHAELLETTARLDISLNPTHVLGKSCGNAQSLAQFILTLPDLSLDQPFLFPCGQSRREAIPNLFGKAQVPLIIREVYRSDPNNEISQNWSLLNVKYSGVSLKWLIFFSPNGFRYFKEIALGASSSSSSSSSYSSSSSSSFSSSQIALDGWKIAAIGKITEQEIIQSNQSNEKSRGFVCDAVALNPSPESLFEAIKSKSSDL